MEFMYFVYVIITLIVARTTWPLLPLTLRAKVAPTTGMSVASKHLYREYKALPEDSRPFPDVARVLRQLDSRFAIEQADLNKHFDSRGWHDESYKFSWGNSQGRCHHTKCEYKDYVDMHKAIETVQRSVEVRAKAEHDARTAGAADMAKELTEALRREADIQMQVTRELY